MKMHILKEDLSLMFIAAQSFPGDIFNTHQKLLSLVTDKKNRQFFGISFFDKTQKIQYIAAVTENFKGEGMLLGLETFLLKKGDFNYINIPGNRNDFSENAFKILLFRQEMDFSENIKMNSNRGSSQLQSGISVLTAGC